MRMQGETHFATNCHVGADFVPCDPAELEPLLSFLRRNEPVTADTPFLRGTMLPDGRLDLCKQRIGPLGTRAVADAVKGHPQVAHVLMGADGLGDVGAAAVADLIDGNPNLKTVYLGCNRISADGVKKLTTAAHRHPHLRALWLKRNPIGPEGAAHVAEMLRHNRHIRTLDLVNTGLGATGLRHLVEALTSGDNGVERLYLCGNRLGPAEAPLLADLLSSCATLRHLYVSVNRLGDDGTRLLCDGLRRNRTLLTLSLSSNGIGADGAATLAEVIRKHPTLQTLELGYEPSTQVLEEEGNHAGDDGAVHLARALADNRTVRSLDLLRNGISNCGARAFLDALEQNRTLTHLALGKGIYHDLRKEIQRQLARNCAEGGQLMTTESDEDVAAIVSVYRVGRNS